RIRRVPFRSQIWAAVISILYVNIAFVFGDIVTAEETENLSPPLLISAAIWYSLVYAVLYASYARFFADDTVGRTRTILAERMGLTAAPGERSYGGRLLGVFALVGMLPAALITADLTVFAEFRAAQGLDATEAVLLDVLAGGFALIAALVFAVRSLTKPVARLDAAIERAAQSGDAHAAVSTDDEIGRLTARFNHMITERREAEKKVEYLARHDPLTGALNRAGLVADIAQKPPRSDCYVVVIDIIDFQAINDGLGFQTGNDVLRAVHDRLKTLFPSCAVARLYGDIFAFATPIKRTLTLDDVAEKLKRAFDAPFPVADNRVRLYPAFGAAAFEPGVDSETLLQRAVMAMKSVKDSVPGRLALYDAGLQERVARRQTIAAGLQGALQRRELSIRYQPIVSLETSSPVGFEALMRWTQADVSHPPSEFIPVAEASGLILQLGDWLNRTVVRDLCVFTAVKPGVYAAINFSGRQIEEGSSMQSILSELEAVELPVDAASVEVTESLAMDESAFPIAAHLRTLRDAGLKLSLDDFGTGHSSLVRLKDIPVHQIKIDRSFVVDMENNERRRAIVRNVISMAADLGLDVVAEGVENKHQVEILGEFGCPKAQGFFFSKPLVFEDAKAFLDGTHAERASG
ncbi:MAG: EAL domain-containing protein, partial [Pseudomonadota bacterium]